MMKGRETRQNGIFRGIIRWAPLPLTLMNTDEYDRMFRLEDEHWWFVARRNLLEAALNRFPIPVPESRSPRLLDVGCGTGGTLDRLRQYGDVIGIDTEARALAFCVARGYRNLALASATALPFANDTFEAAVALDVLEHIPDDVAAVCEISRTLVPGGIAFITVPAYRMLWSRHDVALMHQRRYVSREVGALLTGAGLEILRLSYTVSAILPAVATIRGAQRLLRPNAPPAADVRPTPAALNRTLRALLDVEGKLALSSGLPFGLTVFAAARKPR